ncbi:phytoene desaturase family protein [Tsukamurella paurometabola]|uniref:Dehydrosqualene desaturase n=3 Tax=Tsukamurella paurometabola TaxID=2061 RepID=A0A3P8MAA9_TSUPA|nr:phytoene desaturase family protein [Tsukamurella paurometabola]UEA85379.1 phytoene desaturase [Tsukamurella paurometabola]VDR38000.1 Dehydrosqualene desaturase [Tsukamurella paurometabola]
MHIGIIGAGLSGLSAALHLLGAGHQVTVVERSPQVGGRAGTERVRGHVIDPGASVLTMPELVFDALAAGGLDRPAAEDELDLLPVVPAYAGRFPALDAGSGASGSNRRGAGLPPSVLHVPGDLAVDEHMRWQEAMFDAAYERFIGGDAAWSSYANPRDLAALGRLVKLGALRSMQHQVDRRVADPRARRMLTFQALYAGVAPSAARAVYAVISHMDVGLGVWYPRAGMGRVASVMADQVRRAGGALLLGHEVIGLDGRRGLVTGLRARTSARVHQLSFDGVVLTADAPVTDRLIAPLGGRAPRRVRLSPSAVVAHLDVDPDLQDHWPTQAHHTLDFGAAWEQTFAEITATRGRGRLMSDPSFLITRPSVTTGEPGPVSVLAPCPNLESAPLEWDSIGPDYVRDVLRTLAGRGYRGIDSAEILRVDTPADWARQGMSAGTPFAAAHTLTQTGPLRRPQRVPGIANAVLAGSMTHPGVGVPPALISGRLAAQALGSS